jgi:membrane-associated protease RseP (regulator of RpoE activity)
LEEEPKRFEFQYGVILLKTRRFQPLMDRLGRYKISKPVGWVLLYLMPVVAAIGLFVFLTNVVVLFSPVVHQVGTAVRSISPLAYLGLPGLNPYLPIIDGWAALLVAMIIHEGAHGVVARSLGFPVKSSGLLFFLILPIGAFVEVDEGSLKAAKSRDSGRVLAAGAGVNFVLGVVFLLLLFNVVSTMTPAAHGLGITRVLTASPAASAGITPGDIVVAVNGIHYDDGLQFLNSTWYRPGEVVNVSLWRQGRIIVIPSLTLGSNPSNSSLGYFGFNDISYSDLQGTVSAYTRSFFSRPITYFCLPTFPRCENVVPFSDQLSPFYSSPYGSWLVPTASLLYWFFFLNFNLAIFNALPIYPLDGGQAFQAGLKGLAGGRLSEKALMSVTAGTTLATVAVVLSLPLAAYLNLI